MSYESQRNYEIIGPRLLADAEKKAENLNKKYSPDLKPFVDSQVYGLDAVKKDLQFVLKHEESFGKKDTQREQERKRVADVFETYFVDAANQMNWFGQDTEIMRTTKYDDYRNGVDMIATFVDDERPDHLAMSTDLTYGTKASEGKLTKLIDEVKNGTMAELRYFHSDPMGYTGRLTGIPKTVIGLDSTNVAEFIRLWTHDPEHEDIILYRNVILTQMMDQLKFFVRISEQHHSDSQILRRYSRAHKIVSTFWKLQNIDRATLPRDVIMDNIHSVSA